MTFIGTIKDGLLDIETRREIAAHIADRPDGRVLIAVDEQRSAEQNAYYRVCIKIVADEIGVHPKKLHDHFADKYLEKVHAWGQWFFPQSTKFLTPAEFKDYFDAVKRDCEAQDIKLPKAQKRGETDVGMESD